ncbi:MAG: sodium:proton antiporter [Acidobacteria bacterium]|nr:sodium:proton antiporter [Acidobacteriota bacterium]
MTTFALLAILITITALLSYLNERYLRLPPAIGVMTAALGVSIVLILLGQFGLAVDHWAEEILRQVDFNAVLMEGMLSFLLFAGALHVNLEDLLGRKWSILSLATFGVILSTLLVGTAIWGVVHLVGLSIPYIHALLFGALISPTDPIAVLSILRTAKPPKSLEVMITGESLFNDGVGVVVFIMIMGFLTGGSHVSISGAAELFLLEAVGGALLGFALGYLAYRLIKSVDNYTVEIFLTLALVSGGYALADAIHTSGPIAMVVAGLLIGNHGRVYGMSERTRQHLDGFWELTDELLNAVLFVMIGFELLVLELRPVYLVVGFVAIPLVLIVRVISVWLPISVLKTFRTFHTHTVKMMTWCGVRGGISIALALSIPASPQRDLILVITYTVVVFSILVQGLTVGKLTRWVAAKS